MVTVERIAHRLCALSGTDPDAIACRGEPVLIPGRGYLAPDPLRQRPAWMLFITDAEAVAQELDPRA